MDLKFWIIFSIIASVFWGIRSAFLFVHTPTIGLSAKYPRWGQFFIYSYQFIFNFVGSMAGWACFYALFVRVSSYYPSMRGFNFGDVLLFIFSVIGLSGHLPQAIAGFIEALGSLANVLAKKIAS